MMTRRIRSIFPLSYFEGWSGQDDWAKKWGGDGTSITPTGPENNEDFQSGVGHGDWRLTRGLEGNHEHGAVYLTRTTRGRGLRPILMRALSSSRRSSGRMGVGNV
jgi:hypothetical protein